MPDELDVNAVSSPADVAVSSTEPETPEVVVAPVEEAKIPLSRLNEVLEQKKQAEAREARLLDALQQARQPAQTTVPVDFWEGRTNHPDPSIAQQWQVQKQIADYTKQEARREALAEIQPVLNAGRAEIARLNTERFREKNPDIKAGSEDEQRIVAYMSGQMDGVQHPLESAKRNAMYDRLETENRALKSKQSAIPHKAAANVETSSGIPATAGLPGKPGGWRQEVADAYDASGGDLLAVANVLTGKKR